MSIVQVGERKGLLINLRQAANSIPGGRNGRPTHPATICRWITEGSPGPGGETVRLRAIRMGGRWLTRPEWLEEFGRRLTPTFDAISAEAEGVSS
jgi:hypothetical protein